jgi:C1A family cysteine protease
MKPLNQRYGWQPDLPDKRDRLYKITAPTQATKADLRPLMPPVYDQAQLGSCTANSIAGGSAFLFKRNGVDIMPSRLFIYYNERVIEDTVNQDSGAQLRDGIKAIATYGECPEALWPYDPTQFAVVPPDACFAAAVQHKALTYERISNDVNAMKTCLANGLPFVFGFTVYDSFESEAVAATGMLPMPGPNETVQGGHAVLAVGFDDATQMFTIRNSWGPNWGDNGYFYMPYAYLSDESLADDRWAIDSMA